MWPLFVAVRSLASNRCDTGTLSLRFDVASLRCILGIPCSLVLLLAASCVGAVVMDDDCVGDRVLHIVGTQYQMPEDMPDAFEFYTLAGSDLDAFLALCAQYTQTAGA